MEWNDGSYYEGEWHKGLQHGQGRLCLPDGRVKEGIFRNNKFQGSMLLPSKQSSIMLQSESMNHGVESNEVFSRIQSDKIPAHRVSEGKRIETEMDHYGPR